MLFQNVCRYSDRVRFARWDVEVTKQPRSPFFTTQLSAGRIYYFTSVKLLKFVPIGATKSKLVAANERFVDEGAQLD
jgi:hypothetical protein